MSVVDADLMNELAALRREVAAWRARAAKGEVRDVCLLYTSPSPRD